MKHRSVTSCSIPSDRAERLGVLEASCSVPVLTDDDIFSALEHPFWKGGKNPGVFDLLKPGRKVCIVISDHTRKTAMDSVLRVFLHSLLNRPDSNGQVRLSDISLLVATGIHRHPSLSEIRSILGADLARCFEDRIFMHDPDDNRWLAPVGTMNGGQEVRINRRAVEADTLILTGVASYHYHAGFGGGRKSLIPGLADRSTIAYTHSLTLDPIKDRIRAGVEPGALDGNPVAEAILEAAKLHPPDFIINTVLCGDGRLAGVFAGEMNIAHRAACRMVEKFCGIDIQKQADFTIASAENASNWIQSHKALFSAYRTINERGRVILMAPCPEGLGDERFRHWITRENEREICAGLRQAPEVLGQTALSTRSKAKQTILVTDMNRRDAADLGITTAEDLDSAIAMTLDHFQSLGIRRPSYYLMPNASCVMPFLIPMDRKQDVPDRRS